MFTTLKRLFGPLLVFVLTLSFVLPAGAQEGPQEFPPQSPPSDNGQMVDESTDLWFVQLASPPAVKGTSRAKLKQEKDAFRAEASALGLQFRERYAFDTLWNGLSVKLDRTQLSKVARVSGVTALYPVLPAAVEPMTSASPEMATALVMTGADAAQSELGLTGKGIRVAVMDTGVDYNHPDLGGGGANNEQADFPNSRVVVGHDFVGSAFSGPASTPVPDAYPDDCNGHGTHVAGIIGASPAAAGGVTGVAPEVTFGAYRVFGCEGSTTADIMIAAMERALADKMHILNMSIGSAFMTWPQYPTAAASDELVDADMVVVASIGNSGANGVYSAGAPGVGRKVIGVASFDNSHVSALTFRVGPDGRQVPYQRLSTTVEPPTSGTTPEVAYIGRGCTAAEVGADDAYLANPSGKVALVDRGACTFNSKYQRAVDAGAVAVVVANNSAGLFAGGGVVNRGVPGIGISKEDGDAIKALLGSQPMMLTWTDERVNAVNPTGGTASSFTSYGMTAELELKPDIGGPGGLIRSTYPLEKEGYAILSGTSMSSPHVAGTAALFLEARPDTSPLDLRTILQNSADPVPFQGNRQFLETVHRQGAGMVDIDDAILATTVVEPCKIALGEGTGGTQRLTIRNNGSEAVTYTLSHRPALGTRGRTNAPILTLNYASALFSAPSVTVPAGGSTTVDVTITANTAASFDKSQYGGYVILTPQNGDQPLSVPYAGFRGDYQSIQVLTPVYQSPDQFPWLAKQDGTSFDNQPEGATYTTKDGDVPFFLLHLEHQAQRLEMQLLDAATGQPVAQRGRAKFNPTFYVQNYLGRNGTATAFFAYSWDGTLKLETKQGLQSVPQPDGQYKVKVSVLKALGDPANASHWETWTSPTITIDRP